MPAILAAQQPPLYLQNILEKYAKTTYLMTGLLENRNSINDSEEKKINEEKRQLVQAKKDKADFNRFMADLEKLEEGQQELIKTIVGKIYEALKESDVMVFASTPASVDIGEEVLKAAYHISNLTWRHEK